MTVRSERAQRKELGRRLRALRKRRGERQIDVGNAVGMDRAYLSRIEAGKVTIGIWTLMSLTKHYGSTLSEVLLWIERAGDPTGLGIDVITDPNMPPDEIRFVNAAAVRNAMDTYAKGLGS